MTSTLHRRIDTLERSQRPTRRYAVCIPAMVGSDYDTLIADDATEAQQMDVWARYGLLDLLDSGAAIIDQWGIEIPAHGGDDRAIVTRLDWRGMKPPARPEIIVIDHRLDDQGDE